MAATIERVLGKSIKRREDPRFITGKGTYTDDVKLPGMTYAAFVRSPHAHARIKKIDTAPPPKHPGVVAVFTGKDMTGVNSLPCGWLLPELKVPPHMPLASDAARYVGDPVAVVIAETQYAARDAAEKVQVDLGAAAGRERTPSRPTAKALAADPRGGARQHGLQVADRRRRRGHRPPSRASPWCKKRIVNQRLVANADGAARLRGPLRRRHRRADAVGDLAEPARAPAADGRLRARHPRAQGPGHRARRRRRLRLQDLPLQRGDRLLVGDPQDQAAGQVDVDPSGGIPDRRPRP